MRPIDLASLFAQDTDRPVVFDETTLGVRRRSRGGGNDGEPHR